MSVEELKQAVTQLSAAEQTELSAFLFRLRHQGDSEYQSGVESRLSDKDRSHWLTPEEFEKQLDQK